MKDKISNILNQSKELKNNKELYDIFKETFNNLADEISDNLEKIGSNILSSFYEKDKPIITTIVSPNQLEEFSEILQPALDFKIYNEKIFIQNLKNEESFICNFIGCWITWRRFATNFLYRSNGFKTVAENTWKQYEKIYAKKRY